MPQLILTVCVLLFAQSSFVSSFGVDTKTLSSTGSGDYFILEPGYVLELAGGTTHLVITVLTETRVVDGVVTRVVEERETDKGALIEISRNYFAIDPATHDVYYFGEDVDMYKNGNVTSHEGSWLSGVKGARFGLAMPGTPVMHQKYHQEVAPGVAMDRAEIIRVTDSVKAPAGVFTNCVKTEETTPLEPGVKEYKLYAKGVGVVQDGDVKLVSRKRGS